MRRLLLVLASTALLVAWAFASSALAQGEEGCKGLTNALVSQEQPALLPEAVLHNPTVEVIITPEGTGVANPSQGEEHSEDQVEELLPGRCFPGPPK